jgi:hypothetical protein
MNRNEQEMYSNISSIAKSLEKIAKTLDNKVSNELVDATTKDIPGFEGVLNDLDNLYQPTSSNPDPAGYGNEDNDVQNDYLNDLVQGMNQIEYLNFHNDMSFSFASNDSTAMSDAIYELEYEECLGAIQKALFITGDNDYVNVIASTGGIASDVAGRKYVEELLENKDKDFEAYHANLGKLNNNPPLHKDDPYTYDNDLNEYVNGIKNDSDHDIRSTAAYYEDEELANGTTKKDCILDYVTNEFGSHGARYTDIIKFAYYLGAHNTIKYDTSCRGYYAMAFSTRYGGHLVQGGKDYFVKGINKEGKERYFALSFVESATDYWKRIS